MDTRDILRRLRLERQILATLDHPYIARLFDGGSTEDGLPYFVMEPIDGEPIDTWCDRHRLSIKERLELFCKVCAALQYAHQNLVVHRDIKPANLLVTTDGTPKLLDFGIAKLLDHGNTTHYTATAAGIRLLTPNYASPEQVRGEVLTTATDIYSLGVLLYRLLTGRAPYELPTSSAAMERVVCEEIPERPSIAVRQWNDDQQARSLARGSRPDRLARRLRGDLDNIVLMALRKEPQRRYASAQQFSDDLQGYLQALPVLARRDTFRYRTEKFVRRNRLGVFAATLVFLSLAIGMVTTTWQARLARAERARAEENLTLAERQRAKAERVSDFLTDLFKRNNPEESKGEEVTAREILDQGARRIDTDLALEPEISADLMDVMGTVYQNLGDYDAAEELLRRALEKRRKVHGSHHPDVVMSLHNLASITATRNDFEAAQALYEEAIALSLAMEPPKDKMTAILLNSLGVLRFDREDLDQAETLFRRSLELHQRTPSEDDPEMVKPMNNLAALLYRRDDLQAAERLMRRTLDIRIRNYGDFHPKVALSLNSLVAVLKAQGRLSEAEELARRAVTMRRRLLGNDHSDLAVSINNLAELLRAQNRPDEAEPHYREALEITLRAFGEQHLNVSYMQMNLADLLAEQGEVDQAETLYRESLTLRRDLLGPTHLRTSYPLLELGRLAYRQGRFEAAEPLLRQALLLQEAYFQENSKDLAETQGLLGACLFEQARFTAAEELLLPAYRALEGKGQGSPEWHEARRRLRQLYRTWGRPQEARRFVDPPA
jgi:serine/threonine-protein kinase